MKAFDWPHGMQFTAPRLNKVQRQEKAVVAAFGVDFNAAH